MRVPRLLKNSDGRAYAWWKKRRYWFKLFGTPESERLYRQWLSEIMAVAEPVPVRRGRLTNAEMVELYLQHAAAYYKGGKTLRNVVDAVRLLLDHDPATVAAHFTPSRLKAVRTKAIAAGLSRTTINSRVGVIRRMFRWAVAEELVSESVWRSLTALTPLVAGRTDAKESGGVGPVPWSVVAATLPHLSPTVRDMVLVQYLCGMRPEDVCGMTPGEIHRDESGWTYRPTHHKTAYRGGVLIKAIPAAARVILERRIAGVDSTAYLFQPQASAAEFAATAKRPPRVSKRYPSEDRRRAEHRARPKTKYRPLFTTGSYRQAIHHGIERANAAGLPVEKWNPNQLRHAISTELARELGQQKAQRWLGHTSLNTTAIYTEIQLTELRQIAGDVDRLLAPRTSPFAT